MQSQMWLCYQENISFYDGYNTQGTLSQEKIINVMICEKLAWRGNVKSIVGRVVRKYNVKFLSEGSDCIFFVELWRSIVTEVVSTALKRSVRKVLIVKSVSLCQTGDIKATALCKVGWRIMESVCQLHSRAPVRKVLNVKFVSRGQFALADKISRGRSTIPNFQRHFLCVKQLISQQTKFWHRCDKTTRSFDLVSNDFSRKINFTAFDVVWLFHISQLPCFQGITIASYHVIICYWVSFFQSVGLHIVELFSIWSLIFILLDYESPPITKVHW